MMLWGGGWPALKILTESVSWEVATFWRFALMTLAFIPVLMWYPKPFLITPKALWWAGWSGMLNMAFMGLSFWGVEVGSAGAGGVVITTLSPVLTVLIAVIVLNMRPSISHLVGLLIGLIGGAVMVELWEGELLLEGGNLVFILCAFVWAALTLSAQKSHCHLNPIHFTFLLGLIATVMMFFVAFPHNLAEVFEQDFRFWAALIYLAVLGQTVASSIYFIASGQMGSSRASSYMFLVPLCALISSYALLGEVPKLTLLIGGGISLVAVYIINRTKKPLRNV